MRYTLRLSRIYRTVTYVPPFFLFVTWRWIVLRRPLRDLWPYLRPWWYFLSATNEQIIAFQEAYPDGLFPEEDMANLSEAVLTFSPDGITPRS